MSGLWSGEYRYDGRGGSVRFTAVLTETDGNLCGTTLEPATFGPLAGQDAEYEATLRGDRCGPHVLFTKRYVRASGIVQPQLLYSGAVDGAFTRLTGRWAFDEPSGISGSFALSRVSTQTASALFQVAAETD